jgi:RNA polymerase sigma-70 factor (ECF subfamily)
MSGVDGDRLKDALSLAAKSVPESSPDVDTDSSLVLLRRAQGGDSGALEALGERYLPRLRHWARGRLPVYARDLIDTEDLVQDAFARTLARLDRVAPPRSEAVFAYFRQAILNRIRDEIRRPHIMDALAEDSRSEKAASGPSPMEEVIGHEVVDRFEAGLAQLSAADRDCIMARIELGLSYQDIADLLAKPSPDAARVAVGRALARLARKMAR